jgi:hypothetical protein
MTLKKLSAAQYWQYLGKNFTQFVILHSPCVNHAWELYGFIANTFFKMQQVILQNAGCSLCSMSGFHFKVDTVLKGQEWSKEKVNRKFPMGIYLVRHSVLVRLGRWNEFTSTSFQTKPFNTSITAGLHIIFAISYIQNVSNVCKCGCPLHDLFSLQILVRRTFCSLMIMLFKVKYPHIF